MNKFSYVSLILVMLTLVSCGGDKNKSGGGSSGVFTSALSTQEGYYQVDKPYSLEVGPNVYPYNPQYKLVMNQAIERANMANLKPQVINGVRKLRARITGQLSTQGQVTGGVNPYYPATGYSTQPTLILQNVELY